MLDCKGNVKFVDTTDPPLIPAVATLRTAPKPDSAAAADDDDTVTSSDSPLSLVLPAAGIAGVVLLVGAVGCYVKRSRVRAAATAAAAAAVGEEAGTADEGSMPSCAQSEESVQSIGSSTDGGGSQQSVESM